MPQTADRSLFNRPLPWACGTLLALLLWGCGTAPPTRVAVRPAPLPAAVAAAPALATAPPPPPQAPALPYSAAVAARFPDPGVRYQTPGLQPDRSSFTSNGELQALLQSLARAGSAAGAVPVVRLLALGSSQQGVPLEALLFSREADTTPAALAASTRPTVLLVGQQHGDEPAGAEALLVVAQELAAGGTLQPLLERINVIVLPRANPDGAAAGRRGTASGIDANRDHLLLRTPEAQAQANLTREFRPLVVVDAHEYTVIGRFLEKFGAVQRFDALLQYATVANLPPFITRAAEEWFRLPLQDALAREGLTAEWYYTTSTQPGDKKVSMGGVQPDTGRNVNGLKNAVSILVETRGVGIGRTHLARRVHTQVTALRSVLTSAAERAADLAKLRQYVDRDVAAQACRGDVVLDAAPTPSEYPLLMLDPDTGADKPVTVAWDSALTLRPLKTRARPCGYWLAADEADAVRRLRTLGVQVQQVGAKGSVRGEAYRETARDATLRQDVRGSIADGGEVLALQVELQPKLLELAPGAYYVGLDQPLANLVVAALEPDTQNSYAAHRIVSGTEAVARVLVRPGVRMQRVP